jgi:transaldolase
MSVETQTNQRLAALTEAGTSVWLDSLRRELITSGELERLIKERSLRGVTSNPAIFEKAIDGSDDYDDQIKELAEQGHDALKVFEEVAIKDVQSACDVMRQVWDGADGGDGFVSLEVEPAAAHETGRTLDQARDFWKRVDRPNLMVKIPATDEGVPAIEAALAEGININITLLFAVESYENVMEAYCKAMETRLERGESLDVRSVASFFVSRVDTEVDKRLGELGREDLRGTAAVANAREAYRRYKKVFEGERFAKLREAGCPVQRPLWASTGVKDPEYEETKYVATLVGRDTVNTMPMETLNACAEELEVQPDTAEIDPTAELKALEEAGIDLTDVTQQLLKEGIQKFIEPFDKVIESVERSRKAAL